MVEVDHWLVWRAQVCPLHLVLNYSHNGHRLSEREIRVCISRIAMESESNANGLPVAEIYPHECLVHEHNNPAA